MTYGVLAALAIAAVLPLVVPNEYYLEILTQAYVFAILTCLYLNDAIHLHH